MGCIETGMCDQDLDATQRAAIRSELDLLVILEKYENQIYQVWFCMLVAIRIEMARRTES